MQLYARQCVRAGKHLDAHDRVRAMHDIGAAVPNYDVDKLKHSSRSIRAERKLKRAGLRQRSTIQETYSPSMTETLSATRPSKVSFSCCSNTSTNHSG